MCLPRSRKASRVTAVSYKAAREVASREIRNEELRSRVFIRDGYRCVFCAAIEPLSVDHIIPVAKGGGNEFENLQTLCVSCNSRKKDKINP